MVFKENQWILLSTVLVFIKYDPVESILTKGPSDVVAFEGSTVVFSCYTNLLRPVYWDTEKAGDNHDNTWYAVYQGNPSVITYQFVERFNMSIDSIGSQYNLTIHDVQLEDAGTYRCGDNFGLALEDYKRGIPNQGATAELTVIGNNLTCSQNTGNNYSGVSDTRQSHMINCSILYEGRIPQNLQTTTEWINGKSSSDGNKHNYTCMFTQSNPTTDYDVSRSTMTVSARQGIDNSLVACSVRSSSGDLTISERENNNSLIEAGPLLGVLLAGLLLDAIILALILSTVLAVTCRKGSFEICKYRITATQINGEASQSTDSESKPLTSGKGATDDESKSVNVPAIEWFGPFATQELDKRISSFDDSELNKSGEQPVYITGMKFFIRVWHEKFNVIGGILVTYSNNKQISHGYYDEDCVSKEFTLEKDERINQVTIRYGYMIDGMSFRTNKQTYGHFGGDGGTEFAIGPPSSYLTVLKGRVYLTDHEHGLRHLAFGWSKDIQ